MPERAAGLRRSSLVASAGGLAACQRAPESAEIWTGSRYPPLPALEPAVGRGRALRGAGARLPYEGTWIKLVGPQGVFKPKELRDGPLTLLSTPGLDYEDEHLYGDEMLYDYARLNASTRTTGSNASRWRVDQ